MSGSALTEFQERYCAFPGLDDLAVGYPRLSATSEQWQLFKELAASIDRPFQSRDEIIQSLKDTVKVILNITEDADYEITFSGSIALERTISALVPSDKNTVMTAPGFDSIDSFVRRSAGRRPVYVHFDPFKPRATAISALLNAIDSSVGAVVLVSPNNPSGLTLSQAEMNDLADACGAVDATLIIDHCFMLLNPLDCESGSAFGLLDRCRWAALWDSSKTVELLGEKFGSISGSPTELMKVRSLLQEIQFESPMGSLIIMNAALRRLMDHDGLRSLNKLIKRNYFELAAVCEKLGISINLPDAGAFALIDLNHWPVASDSLSLAERLFQQYKVSVMPSRLLYPAGFSDTHEFLRVSLSRPREMIQRLGDALTGLVARDAIA